MDTSNLMERTVDIVSAHVRHNSVAAFALPRLIRSVYDALAGADRPAPAVEPVPEPKVPIRSPVRPDVIICLECGARLKMLKRHIETDHGLSPADYRARRGLAADYPMTAPDYAGKRREIAKRSGLGRKPGDQAASQAPANKAATVETANGK